MTVAAHIADQAVPAVLAVVAVHEDETSHYERDPDTGVLRSIPGFERVYLTALHAMRDAQAVRGARHRALFHHRHQQGEQVPVQGQMIEIRSWVIADGVN